MGFLGSLLSLVIGVGSSMLNEAQENADKMNNTYSNASNKSTKTLVEKYKSSSGAEKAGYAKALHERMNND